MKDESHTLYGCVDWNSRRRVNAAVWSVTPCMGVWIETKRYPARNSSRTRSHPVWVCGLKHVAQSLIGRNLRSHPVWVCGLKHSGSSVTLILSSHTLYGCVDWNSDKIFIEIILIGHTLYGCVDWNQNHWYIRYPKMGHTLYGCVDWNKILGIMANKVTESHPVWVCGLKHI